LWNNGAARYFFTGTTAMLKTILLILFSAGWALFNQRIIELPFRAARKSIERPRILPFIVAQNVIIFVIGNDAEIHRIKRVPLAVKFLYTKIPSANP
jgi:hypothetical protein